MHKSRNQGVEAGLAQLITTWEGFVSHPGISELYGFPGSGSHRGINALVDTERAPLNFQLYLPQGCLMPRDQ